MSTKTKVFPHDAIINVPISGAFYSRLVQLMLDMSSSKTKEELADLVERLKTEEPKESFEYHYLTLLVLIAEVEKLVMSSESFKEVEPTDETPVEG
jgi:hypothetical protein